MTSLKRAVNGYDYISYDSEYLMGEWDVLPSCYGKVMPEKRRRAIELDTQVEKRVHPQNVKKRKTAIQLCALVLVAFSLLVAVVYRHAVISELHMDSLEQQENIEQLSARVDSLEATLNSSRDLSSIMKRAEELGMDYANADEVKYVDFNYTPQAFQSSDD